MKPDKRVLGSTVEESDLDRDLHDRVYHFVVAHGDVLVLKCLEGGYLWLLHGGNAEEKRRSLKHVLNEYEVMTKGSSVSTEIFTSDEKRECLELMKSRGFKV